MEQTIQLSRSCQAARRSFIAIEAIVLLLLLAGGVTALLQGNSASTYFLLFLVYAMLGGLCFLSQLSSLACPARVLLAGVAFLSMSVALYALLF